MDLTIESVILFLLVYFPFSQLVWHAVEY
uniref:Uncharacterized protein n=1 Tax=Arundo donax TaxID=35708 RepID=A0A0A8YTF7_ARUDO